MQLALLLSDFAVCYTGIPSSVHRWKTSLQPSLAPNRLSLTLPGVAPMSPTLEGSNRSPTARAVRRRCSSGPRHFSELE